MLQKMLDYVVKDACLLMAMAAGKPGVNDNNMDIKGMLEPVGAHWRCQELCRVC